MSEIRRDLLTGEWVVMADNRMKRPYDFERSHNPKEIQHICTFCPGNEEMTPEAIYEEKDAGGWSIRVFPNKYPAVYPEFSESCHEEGCGPYTSLKAWGVHEIIVDTPRHDEKIHDFSNERMNAVLMVMRQRYEAIKTVNIVKYIHIFKNFGPKAGASISHSHWQIIGVPFLPKEQSDVYENTQRHFEKTGESLFDRIIEFEKREASRVLAEDAYFIAFVPYASRFAYEINILSKEGGEKFGSFSDEKITALGGMLKKMLYKVSRISQEVCYNIIFDDAPKTDRAGFFHWYARIIPRLGQLAGFEFGTRGYINHVYPESAADYYNSLKTED